MSKETRNISFCPHCSNRAPQKLVCTQHYLERAWNVESGQESEPDPWSTFIATCETCHQVLLYDNPGDHLTEDEFHLGEILYPEYGLHSSVPEKIRKVYDEASRIKWTAPNAFAVQIRRALEALCDDRKANGRNLSAQLEDLANKKEIPIVLNELAHTLRLLGNIGAHSGTVNVHQHQVYELDEFFRVIIEYVYVAPGKLENFKKTAGK